MKQLVFVLLTIAITVQSYANPSPFKPLPTSVYVVQLGAFSNPQVDDFSKIKSIGHVYTEQVGKVQRVLLGQYEEESNAQTSLAAIHAAGFVDAFVANRKINPDAMIYSIQLKTYEAGENIEWDKWRVFSNLQVNLSDDGRVKVLTETANNITDINRVLQDVRAKGVKGAFIKHINKGLIHKVSPFEMDINQRQLKHIGQIDEDPNNTIQGDIGIKGGLLIVKPSDVPVSYDEYNKESRNSVKQLQALLSENSNYRGEVDGVFGRGTKDAFEMFEDKNGRYALYKERAKNRKEVSFKGGLQEFVNMVYDNPLMAYGGLKNETHPMADVYLAYMYYTGKANPKEADKATVVNRLMNSAIQRIFVTGTFKGTTELDFSKTYNYDNLTILIRHISYMQDAMQDPPSLPCWLFENHPDEAASMFNRLYSMVSGCGDFMEWEELKVLKTIAEDLDPVNHITLGKADDNIRMAYDSRRAQLYLAPTISQDEAMVMETWNKRLWSSLNTWRSTDLLHEKMVTPLEIAYYRALVKLENHYMGRGFNQKEAHVLGLGVMRTVVNYHLNTYVR
jgi:hypothetical protein